MTNTDLILAGMPDELPEIRALGVKSAVLGYRISDSGHLLSVSPGQGFGGILVLSDDGSGSAESPAFDRQLASLLRRGRFLGVFADFDACTPPLAALTGRLSALCAKEGLSLYVPEIFSVYAPDAFILIGSDVAAGSFELRLAEQKSRFGERLALELVPMRADFLLPSQGRAHPLSEEALDSLLARGAQVYFSQELCVSYFTYRAREGTHFVAFDDARSLSRKLELAEKAGVSAVFALYREVRALLPDILLPDGEY